MFSINLKPYSIITTSFSLLLSMSVSANSFTTDIVAAAHHRTQQNVTYNGAYTAIAYPNGDVAANIGVCTDVIIRSYRTVGTDLQKLVHEDMKANFSQYPSRRIWGLKNTDKNIDHRRVPNLQAFFKRQGQALEISTKASAYSAGDIVTWMINAKLPHIGIVTSTKSKVTGNPMIVHNIGRGPELEDMLFSYKITGHYQYVPKTYKNAP